MAPSFLGKLGNFGEHFDFKLENTNKQLKKGLSWAPTQGCGAGAGAGAGGAGGFDPEPEPEPETLQALEPEPEPL